MRAVDIIEIKKNIATGRLVTKINMFGNILLEDTMTCEAVKIMTLPEGYSFRPKGKWEPLFIYTSHNINHPMESHEGWTCSECGWTADEKHDYCVCGADMRESNRPSKELQELLETL